MVGLMQFGISYLFFAGILASDPLEQLIYGNGLMQRDYDAMLKQYTRKDYNDRIPNENTFTGYALHDVVIKALLLSKNKTIAVFGFRFLIRMMRRWIASPFQLH